MKIEIWSDVVCPWCFIGKRRFEAALAGFAHREDVEVVWRSFELDRNAPRVRELDYVSHLSRKYRVTPDEAQRMIDNITQTGAQAGVDLHFEIGRPGNSFDAHRLVHLAAVQGVQETVVERLFTAMFTEGEAVGDPATLARLGAEAGLDPAEVDAVLGSDRYAVEVRADEEQARVFGINAVPFFVVDRKFGVAGAQPPEAILQVLEQAWQEQEETDARAGASTA